MAINKQKILENICYTDLVYGRINKKLGLNLSREQIEKMILRVLIESDEKAFLKKGKNYYVVNHEHNMRITINSFTYRVITVDRLR